MLRNYLIISIRSFKKQKLFSIINILGLTIGMTISILIFLWVQDEMSYDKFHTDLDRIYRVYEWQTYSGGGTFPTYATPGALATALQETYPEIEAAAQFSPVWSNVVFKFENKLFSEDKGYFAGPEIFGILDFKFLEGRADNALTRPHTMVINRSLAERYFGPDWQNEEVVGRSILISNNWQYEITAVVEDYPSQSMFDFDFMIPFESVREIWDYENYLEWGSNYTYTYLKLKSGSNAESLAEKLIGFIKEKNEGSVVDLHLNPLSGSYLYRLSGGGRIQYVRIFSAIAIFILLIACINFMNLATAKSGVRSKEVGIRKSIGADRKQLIIQFLVESVSMAFISLVLTVLLIHLLIPFFNDLTGKSMTVDYTTWKYIAGLIVVTLATGLIAGSYPALYISSFKPTDVLKGVVRLKGAVLRKVLVIFQFTLSVILIVGTLVINQQLFHIQSQEIGYQKEHIIFFEVSDNFIKRYQLLKNEFLQIPEVDGVSASSRLPVNISSSTSNVSWPQKDPNITSLIHFMHVDYDFVNTMNMELAEGRDFSSEFGSDSLNFLVNETFARLIDETSALNEEITMWGENGHVVGVIRDFNYRPLTEKVDPMIIRLDPDEVGNIIVRFQGEDLKNAFSEIESTWTEVNPDLPFEYQFLDQEFDKLYRAETMTGQLFNIFSGLAIFISCLGLFGLAAFMSEHMRKEIGIRKVLGASIRGIIIMFSKLFTKWVIIANLIALPIAFVLSEKWLEDYVYRIQIDVWTLVSAAGLSLFIALLTVIYQSLRTAMINPVDSLRNE